MDKQKHSRAYHRYFENYAELEIPKKDGGYTIQRVYVGSYYKIDLPDAQLTRQRIALGCLFLLCVGCYIAGALTAAVSALGIVALATMPPLIALVFLGIAMFYRLTVPREMEIRSYRDSSQMLLFASMASFICLLVCACFTLRGCWLSPLFSLQDALPSLPLYLVSAACTFGIYRIEKKTAYQVLPPKQERPSMSSPIRYEMPE